jgi:hypothetical protein
MGQIGYVLAQALSSAGCPSTPLLCQVVVDGQHEAFKDPTKFVGPIYGAKEATALSQSLGWVMKPDGEVRSSCFLYGHASMHQCLSSWIEAQILGIVFRHYLILTFAT